VLHHLQFHGTREELEALVQRLGFPGHWVHQGPYEMFVFDDGESNLRLNWWPDTGAVRLVGDPAQRQALVQALGKALEEQGGSA
jgi:hypothetical protein